MEPSPNRRGARGTPVSICRFSASGLRQFFGRVDGPGGFAVVETDDPALIARDTAIFSAFFDFTVSPALDIQESARISGEAYEFRRSV